MTGTTAANFTMSKSLESLDLDDIVVARSLPQHEISLPNTEIFLTPSTESLDQIRTKYDSNKTRYNSHEAYKGAHEEVSHYDQIEIDIESAEGTDMNQKSVYALKSNEGKKRLALLSRGVLTRQCKFDICEEYEQFQTTRNQSVSCPASPLAGNKREPKSYENPGYAASEPGTDAGQDDTDTTKKPQEPFPFHFLFSTPPSRVKESQIIPNPNNKINQRFHSTLQCPCFLFFFFLCCVPAVHFMQWSDHQFKKGNKDRSRQYGRLSTVFYLVGIVIGVAFLSISIYFAADYVRQFVE